MHVVTHLHSAFFLLLLDTFFSHPFLEQASNIKKCKNNDHIVTRFRATELFDLITKLVLALFSLSLPCASACMPYLRVGEHLRQLALLPLRLTSGELITLSHLNCHATVAVLHC